MWKVAAIFALFLLVACAPAQPLATQSVATTNPEPTLQPTDTVQPTDTPQPTFTFQPTHTPLPAEPPVFAPPALAEDAISPQNVAQMARLGNTGKLPFGEYSLSPDWTYLAVMEYVPGAPYDRRLTLWDGRGLLAKSTELPALIEGMSISREGSINSRIVFLSQAYSGLGVVSFCSACIQPMLTSIWALDAEGDSKLFPMDIGGWQIEFPTEEGGFLDEEAYPEGILGLDRAGLNLLSLVSGQARRIPAPGYLGLAVHPGGQLVALYRNDEVNVLDIYSEQSVRVLPKIGSDRIWLAVYSPDGRYLAAADDHNNVVYDANTCAVLQSFAYLGGASRLVFSPDGSILAARGGENEIVLWDTQTGQRLLSFVGAGNLWFSPDGSLILVNKTQEFELWGLP